MIPRIGRTTLRRSTVRWSPTGRVPELGTATIPTSAASAHRGVGELGVGSPGAIGNAVFNATGIRIHNLPIHPEDLHV